MYSQCGVGKSACPFGDSGGYQFGNDQIRSERLHMETSIG